MYELLVIAEGPRRGEVVHVRPAPAKWGREERPPKFAIVRSQWPRGVRPQDLRWSFRAGRSGR